MCSMAVVDYVLLCAKYGYVQFMHCFVQSTDQYLAQLTGFVTFHGLSTQYFAQSMDQTDWVMFSGITSYA